MKLKQVAAATLVVVLALGSLPANAQEKGVVVDRVAIELALKDKTQSDQAARESIRALLQRDDVKAMVTNAGLDLRRAESAVSSLEGADLQNAARNASTANELLAGGSSNVTIQISLVSLLLIIIIVILLTD